MVYSAAKAAVISLSKSAAGAATFLASDDAEFVTGEHLIVDGDLTAAGPELSKKFPKSSAKNVNVSGITKGSTGEPPIIRRF